MPTGKRPPPGAAAARTIRLSIQPRARKDPAKPVKRPGPISEASRVCAVSERCTRSAHRERFRFSGCRSGARLRRADRCWSGAGHQRETSRRLRCRSTPPTPANGHRSATLEAERVVSRPGRPDPGTARRPFRRSFHMMRSVTTVRTPPGYGGRLGPGRPYRVSLPAGPGPWPRAARSKNGPRGGLPSPALPRSGPWGSPFSLSAVRPLSLSSRLRVSPALRFGPAPSITSQTIFRLHADDDGRLGPKAPARRAERRGSGRRGSSAR